jgi:hypothetical protein
VLKISAFLFAALIFFVSFFYQEKKESKPFCKKNCVWRCYDNRILIQIEQALPKAKNVQEGDATMFHIAS